VQCKKKNALLTMAGPPSPFTHFGVMSFDELNYSDYEDIDSERAAANRARARRLSAARLESIDAGRGGSRSVVDDAIEANVEARDQARAYSRERDRDDETREAARRAAARYGRRISALRESAANLRVQHSQTHAYSHDLLRKDLRDIQRGDL
jgi:hypothetical protein